jgi:signal transduction histidine kinase
MAKADGAASTATTRRTTKEDVSTTLTLRNGPPDAAACRRLAELLNLDAVGVIRSDGGRRRFTWWAAPDPGTARVDVNEILAGRTPDWITCPRGDDVVFAHIRPGGSDRSASALTAMLAALAAGETAVNAEPAVDLGGVAPEDPIARERTRLAYAIHDGLTQVVTASVLELEWLARKVDVEPAQAIAALVTASEELRKALHEIRAMLSSLTPQAGGDGQPIDELLQGTMERWHLPATWSVEGDLKSLPRAVLDAASSVIRESVANAAKHSSSTDVVVRVQASRTGVEVRVEDRGKGFQPQGTGLHAGHLGMEMMRRRVAEVNGTLDIESSPGRGTRVVARLPVAKEGANT